MEKQVVGITFTLLFLTVAIFGGVGWATGNIWAATTCGGIAGSIIFMWSVLPKKD